MFASSSLETLTEIYYSIMSLFGLSYEESTFDPMMKKEAFSYAIDAPEGLAYEVLNSNYARLKLF